MDGTEAARSGKRNRRSSGRAVRLRRWLLAGAVVLLATLAGLILYARHRARAALLDLPHRLGIDIKSETDGFTISRSEKGRTLFTIHAAKAIQHRDGKTTLRNVQVTLYGEPGTNRVDRIRGAEFEYDQNAGIIRAKGESEIDLASPADAAAARPDAKRIHVTANGLVFDQKAGTGTAQDDIHFEYGTLRGSARGAAFDSHTGLLQLQHDVHVVSQENGSTQKIDAASAVLDRQQRIATLTQATVAQATESMQARQLVIRLRPQAADVAGSIEQVRGTGGVQLRTANGTTASAPTLDTKVSPQNHLQEANLTGGVTLHSPDGEGHSGTATVLFDRKGKASHIRLAQAVHLRQIASTGSTRVLLGDTVDGTLATDAAGHSVLQQSTATGHASLRLLDAAAKGSPAKDTTLAADTLHAFGGATGGSWQLHRIVGEGSTRVEEHEAGGIERISTGRHVEILLAPHTGDNGLESFVQTGRVHIIDHRPATPTKAASLSTADAEQAEYLASAGTVVLTGSPVARNESMQLEANRISVVRATGNMEATGSVKGTARSQDSAARPNAGEGDIHFLAERIISDRAARQATLSGGARPARVWNGTSQMEAPVMELDQSTGTLFAHDASGGHAAFPVRAVLPSGGTDSAKPPATGGSTRMFSQAMRYRQAVGSIPATAEFTGGVRVDAAAGQIQADRATATMRQNGSSQASGVLGGTVDHVVAEGHVRVLQPGRIAAGTRLVYTAATQQFVLTGTPSDLPTVHDSVRGTVTGSSLLFRSGDDSVVVTGAPGQPVRTDLDAPPRSPTNRGKAANPPEARKK